jgi:hypothetical protein
MTQKEIQENLKRLHDERPVYFSVKQFKDGEDIAIEANRNGILAFCNLLLESIDKEHLQENDTYDFPDSFWDDSDIWMTVRIQEGNKNKQEFKESFITQAGCFLALAVSAVVLIVGVVTSFKWLVNIWN